MGEKERKKKSEKEGRESIVDILIRNKPGLSPSPSPNGPVTNDKPDTSSPVLAGKSKVSKNGNLSNSDPGREVPIVEKDEVASLSNPLSSSLLSSFFPFLFLFPFLCLL